ncbi:MAG: DUF3429 domain-containing protein [Proteobacteria bacterium]|nr:DUF3429 domain-containing protein [Pseudomonadota bacterium]
MKNATLDALPRQVAWLGYGGLLPFVGLAITILADPRHGLLWGDALVAYGAVILSFVGALHWGFAMCLPGLTDTRRGACFVWSTVPALVAWPALLADPHFAAVVLVAGFVAHYWQDRRLAALATLPAWYLPLRLRLTSVASVCLLLGGFFSMF